MKRILPLILTILLIPGMLAVPARADNLYQTGVLDLLQYGFANGSDTNSLVLSSGDVFYYDLPGYYVVYNTDIVFYSYGDINNLYFADMAGSWVPMSVESLGEHVYRASLSSVEGLSRLKFKVDSPHGSLFQFQVLSLNSSVFPEGSLVHENLFVNGKAWSGDQTCSFSSTVINGISAVAPDVDCEILLIPMEWKDYDFLTIYFEHEAFTISSISADLSLVPIPYEVDYLAESNVNNEFRYAITLDLRGLSRAGDYYPNIRIQCRIQNNDVTTFQILNAVGCVLVDPAPVNTYWYTKILDFISTGFGNAGGWISDQTSSLVSWLSQLNTSLAIGFDGVSSWLSYVHNAIGTGFSNVSTWISNQTFSITSSISGWGQSLKDSIDALPDKIAEALKALMVPSDSAIQDFGESSQEIAQDRFGGVYEGAMIVDSFAGQLKAQAATQILTVPVVNLNILGTPFPLGGWQVDLVPEGSEVIIEAVKLMIDILATLAFINGIKSRLERTLEQ